MLEKKGGAMSKDVSIIAGGMRFKLFEAKTDLVCDDCHLRKYNLSKGIVLSYEDCHKLYCNGKADKNECWKRVR